MMLRADVTRKYGILVFGEALFDVFPDGTERLGGAPFNVAWHLQGFGLHPMFVSRIGTDSQSGKILHLMSQWGMQTQWIQNDPGHPTGRVLVNLKGGSPEFEILPDQAFDHIDFQPLDALTFSNRKTLFYHGTLALRSRVTTEAFMALRDHALTVRFVDVNLRPPWWDKSILEDALKGARWIKLNTGELQNLEPSKSGSNTRLEKSAWRFLTRYGSEAVIVTNGSEGSFMMNATGGIIRQSAARVDGFMDSVGTGDAFSAVCMMGLLQGWPWETILSRASDFAAVICQYQGAVCETASTYHLFRSRWRIEDHHVTTGHHIHM